MRVTVSSHHAEVSDDLRAVAIDKVGRLARFLDGLERAEVHFAEEPNQRKADREICEVTLEGQGHHIRCKVAAPDGFVAVDRAIEKLEVQLRRLKTRLKNKAAVSIRGVGVGGSASGNGYASNGSRARNGTADDDHSLADESYIIRSGEAVVRRKSFAERPMAVDDAVAQLELLDHDFFLFVNSDTGHSAVLYRRHSGGLGLLEQVGA